MRIAIYSSSGNGTESEHMGIFNYLPTKAEQWDEISEMFPEHEFSVYFCLHGGMTVEENGFEVFAKAKNVSYTIIPFDSSAEDVAALIVSGSPDVAVAFAVPSDPFDWGAVHDSIVADKLRAKGIRTIAHDTLLSMETFEKHIINEKLKKLGFNVPIGVYVNKRLFDAGYEKFGIVKNAYKDYIRESIIKLSFPVIIKYDIGLGSFGLSVAYTVDEAMKIISSDNSGMDFLVEERINGINFGVEVFGADGKYSFHGPIIFSSNEDGVTVPFLSVKYGPVKNKAFNIDALKEEILRMANELNFCGGVQVDLMFSDGKWYVIELNPRFSYMSLLTAAIEDKNMLLNYIEPVVYDEKNTMSEFEQKPALSFKSLVYDEEIIGNLFNDFDSIKSVTRTKYQDAEFSEMCVGGVDTPYDLVNEMKRIQAKYPDIVSEIVISNISKLIDFCESYSD